MIFLHKKRQPLIHCKKVYEGIDFMPLWVILAVCGGIFLILVAIRKIMKSKHPVRSALLGLLVGPVCMIVINIISIFTNVSIPISPLSLGVSSTLGIPGVTAMLLLQIII